MYKPGVNACYRQGKIRDGHPCMPPHWMKSDYDRMTQIRLVLSEVRGAVKLMAVGEALKETRASHVGCDLPSCKLCTRQRRNTM